MGCAVVRKGPLPLLDSRRSSTAAEERGFGDGLPWGERGFGGLARLRSLVRCSTLVFHSVIAHCDSDACRTSPSLSPSLSNSPPLAPRQRRCRGQDTEHIYLSPRSSGGRITLFPRRRVKVEETRGRGRKATPRRTGRPQMGIADRVGTVGITNRAGPRPAMSRVSPVCRPVSRSVGLSVGLLSSVFCLLSRVSSSTPPLIEQKQPTASPHLPRLSNSRPSAGSPSATGGPPSLLHSEPPPLSAACPRANLQ